jgi:hypothetical protein
MAVSHHFNLGVPKEGMVHSSQQARPAAPDVAGLTLVGQPTGYELTRGYGASLANSTYNSGEFFESVFVVIQMAGLGELLFL